MQVLVERQNQETSIFRRQINTSTRKGGEQNTQSCLTYLQLVCCFKQDLSIEMKPREEMEEYKLYYYYA